MLFNPGPTARPVEKIEVLLFKSAGWLFGSRTAEISGLARAYITPFAPTAREKEQISLPPHLERAFLGWLKDKTVPVFRLDSLLDLETHERDLERVILTRYGPHSIGFAVEQVFEVQSVGLQQLELLPPLIELALERPTVWVLLRLDATLNIGGQDTLRTNLQAGQLVTLLDFPGLFNSDEQIFLTTWLSQPVNFAFSHK